MNMQKLSCSSRASAVSLEDLPRYGLERLAGASKNRESISKGGVAFPFPWRLHECLDTMPKEGLENVISWQPHGRSFAVRNPEKFVELIMPRFFNQTKYGSFQRQLNIYGYHRFSSGKDKGTYYHLSFIRGHRSLVKNMIRCKIKGCKNPNGGRFPRVKPAEEPDFYNPVWKHHLEPYIPSGASIQAKALLQSQYREENSGFAVDADAPSRPLGADDDSIIHEDSIFQGDGTTTTVAVVTSSDAVLGRHILVSRVVNERQRGKTSASPVIEIGHESADFSLSPSSLYTRTGGGLVDEVTEGDGDVLNDDSSSTISEWEAEIPTDDLCQAGGLDLFETGSSQNDLLVSLSSLPTS